ncbi:hypothetical protein [Tropicimonas isoalkanivorans]|uniref:Glutathione S-transferase n=1 Tax=Tropicimonas isoalkanivorans TaxID=441112 RepID=A0A1I1R155_9RHOB|nr:hypothetical protein [Tropicimonas isoalkanivorans]SFD24010.1 glutathione S-transferase [Tropicimonas isoalkanivorans]
MATDYTLYYWPLPFRGHFVRYVLAHAGADWRDASTGDLVALKGAPVAEQPVPFMAPPLLHDRPGDLWLAQLPAILGHLGRTFGLYPGTPAQDALTTALIGNAGDVLEEITCNCGRTMWTRPAWEEFTSDRLPRWMQIFEEIGRRHGLTETDGFILGTPEAGLADLATAALWFTMTDTLPGLAPLLDRHAPSISALSRRIATTPAIADMRAAWDAQHDRAYCGGQIEASIRSMLDGR